MTAKLLSFSQPPFSSRGGVWGGALTTSSFSGVTRGPDEMKRVEGACWGFLPRPPPPLPAPRCSPGLPSPKLEEHFQSEGFTPLGRLLKASLVLAAPGRAWKRLFLFMLPNEDLLARV